MVEPTRPHSGTVIWMHGLGATNHDFDDVVPMLQAPGIRFVFPAAPKRPVTINAGMVMPAWYDIVSFDDPPMREEETSVREAQQQVESLIDAEVAAGSEPESIVLMGFSQGGAMALHVGPRYPRRLAGIGVLSGYQLLPAEFEAERAQANHHTPMLFCHGQFDAVVPLSLGRRGYEAVAALGYPSQWRDFPMQHSLCMPEVELLANWLRELGLA